MAHRNSKPKINSTERTKRRWRDRHNILTPQDIEHKSMLQKLKERIFNDKVEAEAMKNG